MRYIRLLLVEKPVCLATAKEVLSPAQTCTAWLKRQKLTNENPTTNSAGCWTSCPLRQLNLWRSWCRGICLICQPGSLYDAYNTSARHLMCKRSSQHTAVEVIMIGVSVSIWHDKLRQTIWSNRWYSSILPQFVLVAPNQLAFWRCWCRVDAA